MLVLSREREPSKFPLEARIPKIDWEGNAAVRYAATEAQCFSPMFNQVRLTGEKMARARPPEGSKMSQARVRRVVLVETEFEELPLQERMEAYRKHALMAIRAAEVSQSKAARGRTHI